MTTTHINRCPRREQYVIKTQVRPITQQRLAAVCSYYYYYYYYYRCYCYCYCYRYRYRCRYRYCYCYSATLLLLVRYCYFYCYCYCYSYSCCCCYRYDDIQKIIILTMATALALCYGDDTDSKPLQPKGSEKGFRV